MMRLTKRSVWMAIATGALVLSSCADEKDYYDENYKKELYKSQWAKNIGEIDPNQDWNLAMRVTAEVDLSHVAAGDYQVSIYTLNPTNENAKLLARKTVNGTSSIGFDCIKGMNTVFVQVVGEQGAVVNGYVEINNGKVAISRAASRAEGEDECPVTKGESFTLKGNSHQDENDQWFFDEATFIKLDNVVTTTRGNEWQIGDYKGILGEEGIFEEGKNNRDIWADKLTHNVYYEMASAGPVTLDLNYRCTSETNNQIGYFFFTGESLPTLEQMKSIDKYVLIPDVTKGDNDLVTYKEWDKWQECYKTAQKLTGSFAGDILKYGENETVLQGTQFKLVYFDTDGKATYTIPAGTKIGFFLIKDYGNESTNAIYYSIASLNAHLGQEKEVATVTYKYEGTTFLGFEDWPGNEVGGSGSDLNDIMFFATGDFTKPTTPPDITPGKGDEGMTWTIACEDLGSTDDFDFNDIVFGIRYVSGTTVATVYPLAAGGTLPANLYFGSKDLGEVHSFWANDGKPNAKGVYPMINTDQSGLIGQTQAITVDENFSLATGNMGDFKIVVKNGKDAVELTAPVVGDTPQMICMPGAWSWPTERTSIVTAYPSFGEWGANYRTSTDWYNNPATSTIKMEW